MTFPNSIFLALAVTLALGCVATAADEGPAAPPPVRAEPFDLSQVRLLDSPFRDAMLRDGGYLLEIEPDRLLSGFRSEAGLTPKGKKYGGWESAGVAGQGLGHYLSALSEMYAATGDGRFKDRADYVVSELAAAQKANGDGYVSATPDGKKIYADIARGDVRVGDAFDLNGGWVPWYVMHKVMAGLFDAARLTGNGQARQVVVALADWVGREVDGLDEQKMQKMLTVEQGGMSEVLANLAAMTGDDKYLKLAERFTHHAVVDPLAAGKDQLNGLHANTQVPKIIGAARVYTLTGDDYFGRAARTFWETVVHDRTFAQGGNSAGEHFFPPAQTAANLSPSTAETCNVYNMLKLTKDLFELSPTREQADYYERALYNQILGSQDPDRGMVTYYQGLDPGAYKTYSTPFDSWWCCVGTGMENHAKYGEAIYFHKGDALWVNLFLPSVLTWADKGLTVRQETDYPVSDTTTLKMSVKEPTTLAVRLRVPAWVDGRPTLKVNGEAADFADDDGYAVVERQWKDGDALTWTVPMAVRAEPIQGNSDMIALLYGPCDLAADLGDAGLTRASFYGPNLSGGRTPDVPVLVGSPADIAAKVKRVEDAARPLTFRTDGIGRPGDVTLRPFGHTHFTRYSVYFETLPDEAAWQARQAEIAAAGERRRQTEARTVDAVSPGQQQSEIDHKVAGENSNVGGSAEGNWRDARNGGHFQYEVRVDPAARNELVVSYWGSDAGGRAFDLLVDGTKIARQTLDAEKPGKVFAVTYPIPASLTEGKHLVTVRFQADAGRMAGGIFDLRVLRQE